MKFALDIASAIFSLAAALLWFLSADVKLRKNPMTMHPISGRDLGNALWKQNRLSAFAAVSAGLAALCQAINLIM